MSRNVCVKMGAVLLFASVISGCANAEPSIFNYIRQDGRQIIRVDREQSSMKFTYGNSLKSDFGGPTKKCDVSGIRCLDMASYFISIPVTVPVSNTWSVGGMNFNVVGRADRGQEPVYMVAVSQKDDTYMFYTFSKERGVESISLQQEGATPDLAKTYFLIGNQGLLAAPIEAKSVHP